MISPEPDRASERRPSKLVLLLIAILCIWLVVQLVPFRFFRPAAEPRAVTPRGALADEEKTNIDIFEAASPAVVYITSVAVRSDRFGFDITEIPAGTGSGFLWDAEGHVVTNFHVIQNADAVQVTLPDPSSWKTRLVGGEPDNDAAIVGHFPRSVASQMGEARLRTGTLWSATSLSDARVREVHV